MGQFGSFKLIKNYTETTKLNDEKFISTEASYRGHQSSRKLKISKIYVKCLNLFLAEDFDLYIAKMTFLVLNQNIIS